MENFSNHLQQIGRRYQGIQPIFQWIVNFSNKLNWILIEQAKLFAHEKKKFIR